VAEEKRTCIRGLRHCYTAEHASDSLCRFDQQETMHFLQSGARVAHQRQTEKKKPALQNEPGQCAVLSRYPAPKREHNLVTKQVAETARGAAGTLLRPAPANKHTCCRGKSLSQQRPLFMVSRAKQSSHRSQCQPDPNCRQHDPGKQSDDAFDQPKKADTTNYFKVFP
jgi:hypothetical protein